MASTKVTEAYIQKLTTVNPQADDVYRAAYLFSPAGRSMAYGGLLFAQSLKAAHLTVDASRFAPHAIHTFFILNVDPEKPVDYHVMRIRDGRSYATRCVHARQNDKVVLTSQLSFCVAEETSMEHQAKMPTVPRPDELMDNVEFCKHHLACHECGEIELPAIAQRYLTLAINSFDDSIFEVRCCDPEAYYCMKPSYELHPVYLWVRTKCKLSDDPDEHRFLVAFITDMSLASTANRPHTSRGYIPSMVMSLDHTVRFCDTKYHADEWMLYECFSPWAKYARAFTDGRLWTLDGRLILTASQESLSRTKGPKSSM